MTLIDFIGISFMGFMIGCAIGCMFPHKGSLVAKDEKK